MKRTLTLMLAALIASFSTISYAGTKIDRSELPNAARAFISKYFAGDDIKKAEKEKGRRGMEYEVDLISGAEIEFLDNGEWKEVKAAKGQVIPIDIVPSAITKYISTNFEGQTIVEISRKRGGYEVELSNGSKLKLTEDAKPIPDRPKDGNRRNRPTR